jgi:signal transduction histidine kinase
VCENIPVTPDPRTELVKSFGIKAYACHPLFSEGRVIGTLSFGTRTRTTFTEDELSLMKTVADQVAIAMEGRRLIEALGRSRDELEMRVKERTEQLNKTNVLLKAERQLFYNVLETLPAYVVLLTPDYYATFANRTFTERFGESHGRRCFEFLFERSEPCEICETYTALKTMAPHQWEWAGPDGRIYFVHDFPFTDVDGKTLILEMGIDITELRRAEDELRDKESQLRLFASQCLTAQETERRRIAAELHDSIASALAGIKFRIEKTAEDMKRGLGSSDSMKDLTLNMAQAIGEVRRIMADLRPSILDDLGILPALNWFCREYEKTYSHLSVQKQIGISEEEVPDPLKTVIFRISQEAMSNVAKHSKASLVDLALQKAGERLELTIQDNGHGFQSGEVAKGFGLSTMRERAELSGGTFAIQSAEGKGTVIRASWPLAH